MQYVMEDIDGNIKFWVVSRNPSSFNNGEYISTSKHSVKILTSYRISPYITHVVVI